MFSRPVTSSNRTVDVSSGIDTLQRMHGITKRPREKLRINRPQLRGQRWNGRQPGRHMRTLGDAVEPDRMRRPYEPAGRSLDGMAQQSGDQADGERQPSQQTEVGRRPRRPAIRLESVRPKRSPSQPLRWARQWPVHEIGQYARVPRTIAVPPSRTLNTRSAARCAMVEMSPVATSAHAKAPLLNSAVTKHDLAGPADGPRRIQFNQDVAARNQQLGTAAEQPDRIAADALMLPSAEGRTATFPRLAAARTHHGAGPPRPGVAPAGWPRLRCPPPEPGGQSGPGPPRVGQAHIPHRESPRGTGRSGHDRRHRRPPAHNAGCRRPSGVPSGRISSNVDCKPETARRNAEPYISSGPVIERPP